MINKIDLLSPERLEELKEKAAAAGKKIYFISALTGEGLPELVEELWRMLRNVELHAPLIRLRPVENTEEKPAGDAEDDGDEPECIWVYEDR